MTGYDLAALLTLVACLLLIPRALRWADKPAGNWSSATYGDEVSELDRRDFEHRPWLPSKYTP